MPSMELNQEDFDYDRQLEETIPETKAELTVKDKIFKTRLDLINEDEEYQPPAAWGENFKGGSDSINMLGRPPKLRNLEKKTNRQIREQELLSLTRKFKPHVAKAVQAAVKIIDNPESADANKLKASALLIQTYRQLLLDTFDHRYDDSDAEGIQEDNTPVFSLKVLDDSSEKEQND